MYDSEFSKSPAIAALSQDIEYKEFNRNTVSILTLKNNIRFIGDTSTIGLLFDNICNCICSSKQSRENDAEQYARGILEIPLNMDNLIINGST